MTADDYRIALEWLGWSHTTAARRLGISRRSSVNYRTGAYPVPRHLGVVLGCLLEGRPVTETDLDNFRNSEL